VTGIPWKLLFENPFSIFHIENLPYQLLIPSTWVLYNEVINTPNSGVCFPCSNFEIIVSSYPIVPPDVYIFSIPNSPYQTFFK
jgi:hypothetical protein